MWAWVTASHLASMTRLPNARDELTIRDPAVKNIVSFRIAIGRFYWSLVNTPAGLAWSIHTSILTDFNNFEIFQHNNGAYRNDPTNQQPAKMNKTYGFALHTHTNSCLQSILRELTNGRCVTEWEILQSETTSHLSECVCLCVCRWVGNSCNIMQAGYGQSLRQTSLEAYCVCSPFKYISGTNWYPKESKTWEIKAKPPFGDILICNTKNIVIFLSKKSSCKVQVKVWVRVRLRI